jgi:hypothetical protein
VRTKRWVCLGAVAAGWIAGCGTRGPTAEPTGVASSSIQGGATDTTHGFVVGVVQLDPQTGSAEICTGSLLAPNLVATARHCVSGISSPQIDCSKATFYSLVPEADLFITTLPVIPQRPQPTDFVGVVAGGIHVPSESLVCGNDIALLILNKNIALPGGYPLGYVVPAISPPMTDPSRSTTVTSIGYGIDTPADEAGVTAGTRRIKENVGLACIPNDPHFIDCFSDPRCKGPTPTCPAMQLLTANEFMSGDMSTCEGDSGSGAYDQAAFNAGSWVGYGVLSRGGVSADGVNCVQPVYTRFDAWGQLITDAAKQAAALGGYAVPAWAASFVAADAGGGAPATGSGTVGADGTQCGSDSACLSNACVAFDGVHFYCASPCGDGGTCSPQFVCEGPASQNYCFPESSVPPGPPGSSGGCTAGGNQAPGGPSAPFPVAPWLAVAAGVLGVRAGRKPGRGRRGLLSGS